MSDFLERLVARSLGLADVIRPRLLSLFEPLPSDGLSVLSEHIDPVIAEALMQQSPGKPEINQVKSSSPRSKGDFDNSSSGEEAITQRSKVTQIGAIKQAIPNARKTLSSKDDNVLFQRRPTESPGLVQQFRQGFDDQYSPSNQSTLSVSSSKLIPEYMAEDLSNSVSYQTNEEGQQPIIGLDTDSKFAAEDQSSHIQNAFSPKHLRDGHMDILASNIREGNAIKVPVQLKSSPLRHEHIEANGDLLMTPELMDGIYVPAEDAHLKPSTVPIAREEMPEQSALAAMSEAEGIKGSDYIKERQIDSGDSSNGTFPEMSLASDTPSLPDFIQRHQDSPPSPASAMDEVATGNNHVLMAIENESSHSERNSDRLQPMNDYLDKRTENDCGHLSILQERSLEESPSLHMLKVDGKETPARVKQNLQVRSPEKWNLRQDSLLEDPILVISGQISGAVKNTEIKGSVVSDRKDEPDKTIKEGKSESLQLKGLLYSGEPDENQSKSMQDSIAADADTRMVLESSGASPPTGSSSSKEALFKENHRSGNHTFNISPIPSKNIDIFQGGISDTPVSVPSTLLDTPNKLRIQPFSIRDSPANEGPSDPVEKPIPQDSSVRPLVISGERVEQTSKYRPEKLVTIETQPFSMTSKELLKDFLKQTGADQEDHAIKDETDKTIKEGKSESLQLKGLLYSGEPDGNQSKSVQDSIAADADRRMVLESSGASPGSSSSKEVSSKENHPSYNHTFNISPIPSKNIDIFQGGISDTPVSVPSTLLDTPNKLRIQPFSIRDSPAIEGPSDPVEKPIPQDSSVRPLISGERVEQTSTYRQEKSITIDAQRFSMPSKELLKDFLKQTDADQEDHSRDNKKRFAILLEEAIEGNNPVSRFDESLVDAGNRSAIVPHSVPKDELAKSLKMGDKREVREDKIEFGGMERAASNEVPEISTLPEKMPEKSILHTSRKIIGNGSIAAESGVSDKRVYSTLARSELPPYQPDFQQNITGETQPVAAVRLALSEHTMDLSRDPGKGQSLAEKDNKQMAAESTPFDEALENSGIGETTKSAETADKNHLSAALPVRNTSRNHAFVQLKGEGALEPSSPEDDARADSLFLPATFRQKTTGEFLQHPLYANTGITFKGNSDLKNGKTDADPSSMEIRLSEFSLETSSNENLWQERAESLEKFPYPGPASRDISDSRSSGNQDSPKQPMMPRIELAIHSNGEIQPSSHHERQSETSGQLFLSKIELVPEGDASMVPSERESKSSEKAPVQSKKIAEKALALDRRLEDQKSPNGLIISPKPAASETGLQKTPSIAPSSRPITAQRSKMGRSKREKERRDVTPNSLSNHDSRTAVHQHSSTNQSPVIQMSAAAPEPVDKVKVIVRRIEVRSGKSDAIKEPLRATPVYTRALSLEEYLRLRGEGKL